MKLLLALICGIAAVYIATRIRFWIREGRKMQTAGYLPSPPSWWGRTFYSLFCRLLARVLCGPVTVIGSENAHFAGRMAIAPNHQHGLDFLIIRKAMPYAYRQIGALKEVVRIPGLPALSAWVGTFTVPVQEGKAKTGGQAAIDACARYLAQAKSNKLLIFLQGKLVFDNVLRPKEFRTGAVRALQAAALMIEDGGVLAFLPVAIYYHPVTRKASLGRRAINLLWKTVASGYASGPVCGATVAIGKPILLSELPTDIREATEVVRVAIQALLDQAIASHRSTQK